MRATQWPPKPDWSVFRPGAPPLTKSASGMHLPLRHFSLKSKQPSTWNVISRIATPARSVSPFGVYNPIIIHHGASAPTGR
jgi:hypothetical protein